jgi:hypothetical protein
VAIVLSECFLPEGVVDLSAWQAPVCSGTPPWLSVLGLAASSTVHIMDLVSASCRSSASGMAACLWKQLVHGIGIALDEKLYKNKSTAIPRECSGTRLFMSQGEADLEDAREMHCMLVAYTARTAEMFGNPRPRFLSLATDKSCMKTFAIQNTAAVLPSNSACWLVPQVSTSIRTMLVLVLVLLLVFVFIY